MRSPNKKQSNYESLRSSSSKKSKYAALNDLSKLSPNSSSVGGESKIENEEMSRSKFFDEVDSSEFLYALVSRGTTVLANYAVTSGNFPAVSLMLLDKTIASERRNQPSKSFAGAIKSRLTYVYDSYSFHYLREGEIFYLCLTDQTVEQQLVFEFLGRVKEQFEVMFDLQTVKKAESFGLDDQFSPVLRRLMTWFSDISSTNQGSAFILHESRETGVENVEKLLGGGEKIELLVDQRDFDDENPAPLARPGLGISSRGTCSKKMLCSVISAVLLLVILYIVLMLGCEGKSLKNCF